MRIACLLGIALSLITTLSAAEQPMLAGRPTPPAFGAEIPLGKINVPPSEGVACGEFFVTPPTPKPGAAPDIIFVMEWLTPQGERKAQFGWAPPTQVQVRVNNRLERPTVLWVNNLDQDKMKVVISLSAEQLRRATCLKQGLSA